MNQTNTHNPPDLTSLRTRLSNTHGPQFWRGLDELADTVAFRLWLEREFPHGLAALNDAVSRRSFLKLMGASLAFAGLTGCTARQPQEQITPFTQAPVEYMPGIPVHYASTLALSGYGLGVLVKSLDGRPIKIEGNPNHPGSLGATDVFAQAEILALYDPDRSQVVLNHGTLSTWDAFVAALSPVLALQRISGGSGLRILTETLTSPTAAAQIQAILTTFPKAKWYQYSPVSRSTINEGARLAFGELVEPRYRFAEAQVVVALDADFLAMGPGRVRYAHDFMDARRVRKASAEMNRLYVVEPTPSTTGTVADHRLPLRASRIEALARELAHALGLVVERATDATFTPTETKWLEAVTNDLQQHAGKSLVLAGEGQPPIVHTLAHALNNTLGNVGTTVEYTAPIEAAPGDQHAGLGELFDDIQNKAVDTLIMLGNNPAYATPADLPFADAISQVKFSVYLGLYNDETAALATWHIPAAHALEEWSDLRAYDGTASIVQPLIAPFYQGRSLHDILALLAGTSGKTSYDLVRAYWRTQFTGDDTAFDQFWREALHDGLIKDSAFPAKPVTFQPSALAQPPTPAATGLELLFRPDAHIWDGTYSNNGWLQELPRPITKLSWDNAALIHPLTAAQLYNLEVGATLTPNDLERLSTLNERVVELQYAGRVIRAPLWITPGQPVDTVTVAFGFGRTRVGEVANNLGFNAYALRSSDAPWFGGDLTLGPTSDTYWLASTQLHHVMEGRDIVRVGTFEAFRADPTSIQKEVAQEKYGKEKQSYVTIQPVYDYPENAWGMTIDLTACIGCNACTIACQAENNIAVVGKDEVLRGRELHWIRIDRYFAGDNMDNPAIYVQPVTCMQCEQAPCELVCPVIATVHDHEGLNNMVYNRCVGTKYCSNNCPFKVRRFNYYQYQQLDVMQLKLMHNPDVTVRNRGIMEKCTFCVQRISAKRILSKREDNRPIADREIMTACEQVCPTQAIVFGDTKNAASQVAALKAEPHNYTVLDELNTKPRTSYLARVRNPNPEMEGAA